MGSGFAEDIIVGMIRAFSQLILPLF